MSDEQHLCQCLGCRIYREQQLRGSSRLILAHVTNSPLSAEEPAAIKEPDVRERIPRIRGIGVDLVTLSEELRKCADSTADEIDMLRRALRDAGVTLEANGFKSDQVWRALGEKPPYE